MMRNSEQEKISEEQTSHKVHTIFYQGITRTQTEAAQYNGDEEIETTTHEVIRCKGRGLKPIKVLIEPFLGNEIQDVNTHPFDKLSDYFNPLKLATSTISNLVNWYHGIEIHPGKGFQNSHSLKGHTINLSEISVGQETDMQSHHEKYQNWKSQYPNGKFIAYGVSRGAATTFNACARYKYPELSLVILEACFYTIHDVFHLNNFHMLRSAFTTGLSLFTKYHDDGPSPAKSIKDFPKNVPVVFITSEVDGVIPNKSTERLARELADKGLNDVYLLTLKRSGHINYVFDDPEDRERYECFLQAIYLKHGLTNNKTFNLGIALKGLPLLNECLLKPTPKKYPARSSVMVLNPCGA